MSQSSSIILGTTDMFQFLSLSYTKYAYTYALSKDNRFMFPIEQIGVSTDLGKKMVEAKKAAEKIIGSAECSIVETDCFIQLYQIEHLFPFGWASINKATQICLKTLVRTLCLTISLWTIGSAESQFSVNQFEQLLPEGASKDFISI